MKRDDRLDNARGPFSGQIPGRDQDLDRNCMLEVDAFHGGARSQEATSVESTLRFTRNEDSIDFDRF